MSMVVTCSFLASFLMLLLVVPSCSSIVAPCFFVLPDVKKSSPSLSDCFSVGCSDSL
jgi:hypothetical protein